jgi:hypothetical protein
MTSNDPPWLLSTLSQRMVSKCTLTHLDGRLLSIHKWVHCLKQIKDGRQKERKGKAEREKHIKHTWLTLWSTTSLKTHEFFGYSRNFLYFTKTDGSLQCSQQPTTCPYPSQSIWSMPNGYSLRPLLILSCDQYLRLSSGILPLMFPCQNRLLFTHLRMWHPVAHLIPNTHKQRNYCFSQYSYVFIAIQEPATIFNTSQSVSGKLNYQN